MAYTDRQTPTQRAASLASAAILQGGIGAILVYGLATTVLVRPPDRPIEASNIPLPPLPQQTPDPTPSPANHPSKEASVEQVATPLETNHGGPTFDPGPKVDPIPYTGPVAFPTIAPPPLPQPPHFTATSARPLGDRSRWVTNDDYPTSEIRREHSGVTGYRVSIAVSGRVSGCEVVKSSGWPALDAATCANLTRRAKFEPGTDTSGAKIGGSYSGSVVWTIPR